MLEVKMVEVTNCKTGQVVGVTEERWLEFKKNNEWHPEFQTTYSPIHFTKEESNVSNLR